MKDIRKALESGAVIAAANADGGIRRFTVKKEIGRGSSCIVYEGSYRDNLNGEKPVRIKECCPSRISLRRDDSGHLEPPEGEKQVFEEEKQRFREAFLTSSGLFSDINLTNSIAAAIDLYEANGTYYTITAYMAGTVLSGADQRSPEECIAIMKSAARLLSLLHKKGFLYLDMKPENIFVLRETTDIVQLFDFDSPIAIESLKGGDVQRDRLRWTNGYAPLELRTGDLKKTGVHSDVFSLGATLFCLIFHHTPMALECVDDAEYDFRSAVKDADLYPEVLFRKLTAFFHRTLAPYYRDRYGDMEQVIRALDTLQELARRNVPFIRSFRLLKEPFLIGREKEYGALAEWFTGGKTDAFLICGMGGIGKSTIAKRLVCDFAGSLDSVSYIHYRGSVRDTVIDPSLNIHPLERDEKESREEFFERKVRLLRRICSAGRHLLVIDDFEGDLDEDLRVILEIGWKVILISRSDRMRDLFESIKVEELRRNELTGLFQVHLRRTIRPEETEHVNSIIDSVQGHTLTVELIASQIRGGFYTASEAARVIREAGFSQMSSEKVRIHKDRAVYHDTILNILDAVFCGRASCGSVPRPAGKEILQTIALFGPGGVDRSVYQSVAGSSGIGRAGELAIGRAGELTESGWLQADQEKLVMHPVIREMVCAWSWDEKSREQIGRIASGWKEKIAGIPRRNREELLFWLFPARTFLECCKQQGLDGREYCNLLALVLLCSPHDQEDYIESHILELLAREDLEEILTEDDAKIRLLELLVNVYLEAEDYESAWRYLQQTKQYVSGLKKYAGSRDTQHCRQAFYYDMLAGYYDAKLDGQYDAVHLSDRKLLLRSLDRAIGHMRRVRGYSRKDELLPRYLVSKAILLTRGEPGQYREIKRLLRELMERYAAGFDEDPELEGYCSMLLAWIHTYSEADAQQVYGALRRAYRSFEKVYTSSLDLIDQCLVPSANMLLERGDYEHAVRLLKKGIALCGQDESGALVYARKKGELRRYLQETYYLQGDYERAEKLGEAPGGSLGE